MGSFLGVAFLRLLRGRGMGTAALRAAVRSAAKAGDRLIAVEAIGRKGVAASEALPELLMSLADRANAVRHAAVEAIWNICPSWREPDGTLEAMPYLLRGLRHNQSDVRLSAAMAMAELRAAALEGLPELVRALADPCPSVRRAADDGLGMIDPDWCDNPAARPATPDLVRALVDKAPDVRKDAAEILEHIDPGWSQTEAVAQAMPNLVAALGDRDVYVREAAAKALGRIGPAAMGAVPELVRMWVEGKSDSRSAAEEALGNIDRDWRVSKSTLQAVAHYTRRLRSLTGSVAAAKALGRMGAMAGGAVHELRNLAFGDSTDDERLAAVKALGAIGPAAREAVPDLVRAFTGVDRDLDQAVEEALAKVGPPAEGAVPSLVQALAHGGSPMSRMPQVAAAQALGKVGPPAAAAASALVRAVPHVGKVATEALRKIGPTAVPQILPLLADSDQGVRASAAEALGVFGSAAADAVPALVRALGDDFVRDQAVSALGRIGPAAAMAVPRLVPELAQDRCWTTISGEKRYDFERRRAANEALERIDPKWWERENAREAVPELMRVLMDGAQLQRRAAAAALDKVDPKWRESEATRQVIPHLVRALGDRRKACIRAAGALGEIGRGAAAAVPDLVRALEQYGDSTVRLRIEQALRRIDPDGSLRRGTEK